MVRYVACALVLAIALTACGPAEAPTTATVAPTAALATATATPRRAGDGAMGLVWYGTRDPEAPIGRLSPRDGYRFVTIDAAIENMSAGNLEYNALNLYVRDDASREYDFLFAGQLSDFLRAGTLGAGGRVRGTVVYEIPQGATITGIVYAPTNGKRIVVGN